nr:zonadhesin-like [Rhipicephalus microplus]
MHYIVILLATSCLGLIDGSRNCTNCGPEGCSSLEQPVVGKPRKDRFCKARFTPSWEKDKLRNCVCKRGFVRNSWGECISKKDCWRCKLRLHKDWHRCASACPTTCGQPVLTDCQKKCSSGCECIPGYVVHPKRHHKCVKADSCLPKCPIHSTFKPCVSSCEPKCSEKHPKKCVHPLRHGRMRL